MYLLSQSSQNYYQCQRPLQRYILLYRWRRHAAATAEQARSEQDRSRTLRASASDASSDSEEQRLQV